MGDARDRPLLASIGPGETHGAMKKVSAARTRSKAPPANGIAWKFSARVTSSRLPSTATRRSRAQTPRHTPAKSFSNPKAPKFIFAGSICIHSGLAPASLLHDDQTFSGTSEFGDDVCR